MKQNKEGKSIIGMLINFKILTFQEKKDIFLKFIIYIIFFFNLFYIVTRLPLSYEKISENIEPIATSGIFFVAIYAFILHGREISNYEKKGSSEKAYELFKKFQNIILIEEKIQFKFPKIRSYYSMLIFRLTGVEDYESSMIRDLDKIENIEIQGLIIKMLNDLEAFSMFIMSLIKNKILKEEEISMVKKYLDGPFQEFCKKYYFFIIQRQKIKKQEERINKQEDSLSDKEKQDYEVYDAIREVNEYFFGKL